MSNSSENVHLNRDLSLFDITMIGVGAMIGAGIFVLTGLAAGAAGPALILAFALNGLLTIFTEGDNPPEYEEAIHVRHIQSTQILESLTEESGNADIMILETTRGLWRHRFVFGRMHKAIAHRSKCPVVLVKNKEVSVKFGVHKFLQFFRDIGTESESREKVDLP